MPFLINKKLGETPLKCLERFCAERAAVGKVAFADARSMPFTYAGRLDPMAEGLLVVLAGEECKQKEKYLGLDKVYETEFLLGVETDTHDVLGMVQDSALAATSQQSSNTSLEQFETVLRTFLGKRIQVYPAYSSKPHKGRPLFELARAGELPTEGEMPSREVEIYQIEVLGERIVTADELEQQILERIALVKGDFRQPEIAVRWRQFFQTNHDRNFQVLSLRIHCSSGTYIRSLAQEIGKRLGTGAIAFSIKRTQVGDFLLSA
ncbi:MAG: hypothetical protein AAB391_00265 [Patescibacteria group bacterium]